MNLDRIFIIFNYANIHIIFPNFFQIAAEDYGIIEYSESEKYDIKN